MASEPVTTPHVGGGTTWQSQPPTHVGCHTLSPTPRSPDPPDVGAPDGLHPGESRVDTSACYTVCDRYPNQSEMNAVWALVILLEKHCRNLAHVEFTSLGDSGPKYGDSWVTAPPDRPRSWLQPAERSNSPEIHSPAAVISMSTPFDSLRKVSLAIHYLSVTLDRRILDLCRPNHGGQRRRERPRKAHWQTPPSWSTTTIAVAVVVVEDTMSHASSQALLPVPASVSSAAGGEVV